MSLSCVYVSKRRGREEKKEEDKGAKGKEGGHEARLHGRVVKKKKKREEELVKR